MSGRNDVTETPDPQLLDAVDAVVVGGGGSGLAAACAALERGGRVLLLEKERELGGTTALAVGSFTACGTSLQLAAGIDDALEAHAEDAAKFAPPGIEARNNEPLRRFFLSRAAATFEWLRELGLEFTGPRAEPPNRVSRMHNVAAGGVAYIEPLEREVLRRGGEIRRDARVVELCLRERRVVGVRFEERGALRQVEARRGVVLAAGDYTASRELIRRHKGEEFAAVEGVNPRASGDGQRLAAGAGARLLNMDVAFGPELRFVAGDSRTWLHPESSLFESGAVLVNRRGERFTDERQGGARELDATRQGGGECYLLLDGRLARLFSAWPRFVSTAPGIGYAYVEDYLATRPDIAVRAAGLDDLARRRHLDPERLAAAVEDVNRERRGGGVDVPPLEDAPWVLLGPAKAYFTTTEGGAAVNERLQVLDGDGHAIAGLHAAGQNGLGGMVLWGHGLHIAWALTSGRLAGEAVMERG
ncbi:MAG: FAD-dependent oxidoreductase [Planctomycetota bacterium]|nr:FAD-dependent oxidoreductase [Planctomycetota bacterium]